MQYFSPRKPTSVWSRVNKERLERLIAGGPDAPPPGLRAIATSQGERLLDHAWTTSRPWSSRTIWQAAFAAAPGAPRGLISSQPHQPTQYPAMDLPRRSGRRRAPSGSRRPLEPGIRELIDSRGDSACRLLTNRHTPPSVLVCFTRWPAGSRHYDLCEPFCSVCRVGAQPHRRANGASPQEGGLVARSRTRAPQIRVDDDSPPGNGRGVVAGRARAHLRIHRRRRRRADRNAPGFALGTAPSGLPHPLRRPRRARRVLHRLALQHRPEPGRRPGARAEARYPAHPLHRRLPGNRSRSIRRRSRPRRSRPRKRPPPHMRRRRRSAARPRPKTTPLLPTRRPRPKPPRRMRDRAARTAAPSNRSLPRKRAKRCWKPPRRRSIPRCGLAAQEARTDELTAEAEAARGDGRRAGHRAGRGRRGAGRAGSGRRRGAGEGGAGGERRGSSSLPPRKPEARCPKARCAADESGECPEDYPIKGNASSKLYHSPGSPSYKRTVPEFCFASTGAAEAAGFSPTKYEAAQEESE